MLNPLPYSFLAFPAFALSNGLRTPYNTLKRELSTSSRQTSRLQGFYPVMLRTARVLPASHPHLIFLSTPTCLEKLFLFSKSVSAAGGCYGCRSR